MKLRKKRKESEREREASFIAVSISAHFLLPSPVEAGFWGRDLAHISNSREVVSRQGGREAAERSLSIL